MKLCGGNRDFLQQELELRAAVGRSEQHLAAARHTAAVGLDIGQRKRRWTTKLSCLSMDGIGTYMDQFETIVQTTDIRDLKVMAFDILTEKTTLERQLIAIA